MVIRFSFVLGSFDVMVCVRCRRLKKFCLSWLFSRLELVWNVVFCVIDYRCRMWFGIMFWVVSVVSSIL